jgi:hypothetical protein
MGRWRNPLVSITSAASPIVVLGAAVMGFLVIHSETDDLTRMPRPIPASTRNCSVKRRKIFACSISRWRSSGYPAHLGRYPHGHVLPAAGRRRGRRYRLGGPAARAHGGDQDEPELGQSLGLLPVTLRFARLVGDILRAVPWAEHPAEVPVLHGLQEVPRGASPRFHCRSHDSRHLWLPQVLPYDWGRRKLKACA